MDFLLRSLDTLEGAFRDFDAANGTSSAPQYRIQTDQIRRLTDKKQILNEYLLTKRRFDEYRASYLSVVDRYKALHSRINALVVDDTTDPCSMQQLLKALRGLTASERAMKGTSWLRYQVEIYAKDLEDREKEVDRIVFYLRDTTLTEGILKALPSAQQTYLSPQLGCS